MRHKTIVITGAAGGLGSAIAHAFARQGAQLALLDSNEQGLHDLARKLRSVWTAVHTEVADLSTNAGVQAGMRAVLAPYNNECDVLVANVGVLVAGTFEEITDAQITASFALNFLSHVWACRAVVPLMKERPGASIVFTGSDQGSQPDTGLFPYAPAKAALQNLTKLLAREYGPTLRVNCVSPGMARTRMVEPLLEKLAREDFHTDRATAEQRELQRRGVPLGRLAEPEEIAEAVLFLAQDTFCSGTILDMSGGNVRGM